VDWALDGTPITLDTPELKISSSASQFTLTIPEVRLNSTGEYSCTASNSVGSKTASALVTGEARPAVILSSAESEEEDRYELVWSVASRAPVSSSVVSVRRRGEEDWVRHEVSVGEDNETMNATDGEEFTGQLELTDLEPGTTYEVRVATRNSFGLVENGEIFTFSTKKQTVELREEKEEEEEESREEDADSKSAVTTASAPDLRPLITPLLFSCYASFKL